MDRVGGYRDLLALEEDALAYDDVVLVMRAEHEARVIRKMESA